MQATGKKPPSEWVSCGSSRGEKVMYPGKSGVQRTLSPVSLAKKKRTAQTMCCRSRNAERRIKNRRAGGSKRYSVAFAFIVAGRSSRRLSLMIKGIGKIASVSGRYLGPRSGRIPRYLQDK